MNDIKGVYDMLVGLMAAGRSPEQAEAFALQIGLNPDYVDESLERYREITESIVSAREPEGLTDGNRIDPWYWGARPGDTFWPALEDYHRKRGFPDDALLSLDRASTKVVSHLPPPWKGEFTGRGLVLGYVQSGKTSNFTATIAKAADAGYRLCIVLSGLHNNLRRQTQVRLDRELVELNPKRWFQLTDTDGDFGHLGNADAIMSQEGMKLLAVVKKNKSRLTNLLAWLSSAQPSVRANCPVLLIDDEADQASVNTKDPDADPSTINGLIRKILDLRKVAYVGYTATPFANIFIDPDLDDLYPRDFIIDLPRPNGYFGPERIFGREPLSEDDDVDTGLDMIRIVPPEEVGELRPPKKKADREVWDPAPTATLTAAIRWFALATAARRARGQGGHSSMLIHTTQLASMHDRYVDLVRSELTALRQWVARGDSDPLEGLWESEIVRVEPEPLGERPTSLAEVMRELPDVLDVTDIIVDNYLSDARLDYPDDETRTVIVIGGNTLSRGLTLEGLVVSFFLRTSTAYDTLLQMARWFGYRRGFSDLPRIWMTAELREYFQFLATVEAEIRIDIERYELEDKTPSEFAVRVRTHPELGVTSALKMQAARPVSVSYSGRRVQTILFEHRNHEWLVENLTAAQRLLDRATSRGLARTKVESGRWMVDGVPVDLVDHFLATYNVHPNARDIETKPIREYIARQNSHGDLLTWKIVVMGKEPNEEGRQIDLGGQPTGLITRTAVEAAAGDYANIKSLMSRVDWLADRVLDPATKALPHDKLQRMRQGDPSGLLLLYPIDRHSEPRPKQKGRVNLNAVEDVIGLGLVFPDATHDEKVTYLAVELPPGDIEEPEPAEFEDREADHAVQI